MTDAADTSRIVRFLREIGIDVVERPIDTPPLLPGVTIENGSLVIDRSALTWPGDLLHEAGHIAVTPAALRPQLGANADEVVAEHAGEAEATAWAYAAVVAIGLDAAVLFHDGGYAGKAAGLRFTYAAGCYPGAAGLAAASMTLTRPEALAQGLTPYPHMIRWLRE